MRVKEFWILAAGLGLLQNILKGQFIVAVESNEEMVTNRFCGTYKQLIGSLDKIAEMETNYYDVIFCHNVLEYINNRKEYLCEFYRVLKMERFVSIVNTLNWEKLCIKLCLITILRMQFIRFMEKRTYRRILE